VTTKEVELLIREIRNNSKDLKADSEPENIEIGDALLISFISTEEDLLMIRKKWKDRWEIEQLWSYSNA